MLICISMKFYTELCVFLYTYLSEFKNLLMPITAVMAYAFQSCFLESILFCVKFHGLSHVY